MTNLQSLSQKLVTKLDDLKDKKVFIFGDIGIDEYVQGGVARISPEAPVPVVEVTGTNKKLGLSGNVAANVQSLGGTPLLFSVVGNDDKAEHLKSLLSDRKISTTHLMTDQSRETTTKLRIMSGQHHVVRVDYENKTPVSEPLLKQYQPSIENGVSESDVVIIQDYAKGLISETSCQMVIRLAKKHGKKVIVDPYRSTPLPYYRGAEFMTPNRDEAFELAKQIAKPEVWKNVDLIGPELMTITESSKMVITLGAEGIKVFENNKTFHLPTFAKTVFDVTGAGDTVIAAFSLGIAAQWNIQDSAFLANMAAGVVVGQVGAVACTTQALRASLNH